MRYILRIKVTLPQHSRPLYRTMKLEARSRTDAARQAVHEYIRRGQARYMQIIDLRLITTKDGTR